MAMTENVHAVMAGAWRQRYRIVMPALIFPVLALLIALVAPDKYITQTKILIQETAKLNPFLEDLAVETNLKDRIDALSALLHSRHVLSSVAEDLGWIDELTETPVKDAIITNLSESLKAKLIGEDLVELSYTSSDPKAMAQTLEAVSKRFIEYIIAPGRSSIQGSEFFLAQELEKRRRDLEISETELAEYKTEHASELPELHATNVQRLTKLRESLAERETDLAGAKAGYAKLKSQLSQTNPVIGRLEEQIVNTMSELAILKSRYTEEHSAVVGANRKLKRLEAERLQLMQATSNLDSEGVDRLWQLATSYSGGTENSQPLLVSQLQQLQAAETKVRTLEHEVTQLQKEGKDLEQKVASFGVNERSLNELERDIRIKRQTYENLLERYENARVTGELGRFELPERVKIIDKPYTPTAPTNPPAILFFVLGIFGGGAFGLGLAIALEVTDTTMRRVDGLEEAFSVPVLCRIPVLHLPKQQQQMPRKQQGSLLPGAGHG